MSSSRKAVIMILKSFVTCGQYTFKDQRKAIINFVRKVYLSYFKVNLVGQDKQWAVGDLILCAKHV